MSDIDFNRKLSKINQQDLLKRTYINRNQLAKMILNTRIIINRTKMMITS